MSLDIIFLFKELDHFTKNIQNYKNKILLHGIETKFKNIKIFYVLEKLTELESNFYKKFSLYYSADNELDKEMFINTMVSIEKRYQELIQKYFLKSQDE